jgi:hypothetical protein
MSSNEQSAVTVTGNAPPGDPGCLGCFNGLAILLVHEASTSLTGGPTEHSAGPNAIPELNEFSRLRIEAKRLVGPMVTGLDASEFASLTQYSIQRPARLLSKQPDVHVRHVAELSALLEARDAVAWTSLIVELSAMGNGETRRVASSVVPASKVDGSARRRFSDREDAATGCRRLLRDFWAIIRRQRIGADADQVRIAGAEEGLVGTVAGCIEAIRRRRIGTAEAL